MASFKQYRAPAANDTALVDPPWPEQLARLTSPPPRPTVSLSDTPLERLAESARRDLLAMAQRYTSAYADVGQLAKRPLIVSGHQPDLFHPGVWFKNFALDSLAKTSGGVGIHLLIDSDLCRETSIRTPTESIETPRVESVPYDEAAATTPYEERTVQDDALFDSFAERAAASVRPLIGKSLIHSIWSYAIESRQRNSNVGRALSEARHRIEREWGSTTLELPFGEVADTEGFRRFAAELLLRCKETASAYNGALDEYRAAHRIRNAAQPLPDLAGDGSWIETPFWVWSQAEPTRRALFASVGPDGLRLSDRAGWSAEGPLDTDGVVAWLAEQRPAGIKIRSRALATTLYCRLVLADLFLHGIGGAKYDQVTDRFCERLLGVTPPPHATLTATLRLPIEHDSPEEQDRRELVQRIRDSRYHPEEFLTDRADADVLAAAQRKEHWIGQRDPDLRAERHAQITAANELMAASLEPMRNRLERDLADVQRGLRDAALLDSREYAFCLFPAGDIRRRLTKLASIPHDA